MATYSSINFSDCGVLNRLFFIDSFIDCLFVIRTQACNNELTREIHIVRHDGVFPEHDVTLQVEPGPVGEVVVVVAWIQLQGYPAFRDHVHRGSLTN